MRSGECNVVSLYVVCCSVNGRLFHDVIHNNEIIIKRIMIVIRF